MSDEVKLYNKRHVEVLKVWYALFTTLLDSYDSHEYDAGQLIDKLQRLRRRLEQEVPIEEIKAN